MGLPLNLHIQIEYNNLTSRTLHYLGFYVRLINWFS